MKLSLYEQETILLYNQAEDTADVYTHDPKLLKKLATWRVLLPACCSRFPSL